MSSSTRYVDKKRISVDFSTTPTLSTLLRNPSCTDDVSGRHRERQLTKRSDSSKYLLSMPSTQETSNQWNPLQKGAQRTEHIIYRSSTGIIIERKSTDPMSQRTYRYHERFTRCHGDESGMKISKTTSSNGINPLLIRSSISLGEEWSSYELRLRNNDLKDL